MFKRGCITLLFLFCLCCHLHAATPLANNTELLTILKNNDQKEQERLLVRFILTFYESAPLDSLAPGKVTMDKLLGEYKTNNRKAFNYFVEYTYQQRLRRIDLAELALVKAIKEAVKTHDVYMLYAFYNELGFLQTYNGNTSEAVYSFSMAKKQSIILNEPALQVVVDINISDIFYKNNFYKQSLFYLRQAETIFSENVISQVRLKNIIYNNIAENYFRVGNIDSLKKYNQLLYALEEGAYKKYTFTKRTDYYIAILKHSYNRAINMIRTLKNDTLYKYSSGDEQNLGDSYFHAGMLDSSKSVVRRLLSDPAQENHPEVKFHLYKVLGLIAEEQNDSPKAADCFKMALQQSEEQISRLNQVDHISSQIKIDEVQDIYTQREAGFKKERTGLIFVVIIAFLTIGIIAMIFSATRQKRYYEQLLFNAKKEELSFINSHEVRRHLSNILGLIDVIKNSEDKHKAYLQSEEHILVSAEKLDDAIKNISEKLDSEE